jgi:hypothetical protein
MRVSNGQKGKKFAPVVGLEVGILSLAFSHRRFSSLGELCEQYCTYVGDGAAARLAEASDSKERADAPLGEFSARTAEQGRWFFAVSLCFSAGGGAYYFSRCLDKEGELREQTEQPP